MSCAQRDGIRTYRSASSSTKYFTFLKETCARQTCRAQFINARDNLRVLFRPYLSDGQWLPREYGILLVDDPTSCTYRYHQQPNLDGTSIGLQFHPCAEERTWYDASLIGKLSRFAFGLQSKFTRWRKDQTQRCWRRMSFRDFIRMIPEYVRDDGQKESSLQ